MKAFLRNALKHWKWVLGLAVGVGIFSVSVGIAGAYVLAHTSTEEFCVSCHEPRLSISPRLLS